MNRRLCKIEKGKIIDGVCGGLAQYLGIDATLVRLIWAAFTLLGGSGIILYIVAAIIMPRETDVF